MITLPTPGARVSCLKPTQYVWGMQLLGVACFHREWLCTDGARRPDPSLACGISSEGSPGPWLAPVRIRCQRAPWSCIQINIGNWPSGKSLMGCGKPRGALMKSFTAVLGSRERIARGQVLVGPTSSQALIAPSQAERVFFLMHGGRRGAVLSPLLKVAAHLQAQNKGCLGFGCTSFSSDTSQPGSKPRLMCNASETLQPCYILHRKRTTHSHGRQLLNGESCMRQNGI